jgi:carbon-monoxide dehydrogenase medium subunit
VLVALRSRRQIAPFALHHPATLTEALAARSEPGSSAFLAGGIDLMDWLKHGHTVDRLIRLDGVAGLADITGGPGLLRIGAMATHDAIARSALVRDVLPDLATQWDRVANPRIRFIGTIGGNVMAARPDYDAMPALLALDAKAEIAAGAGVESVSLDKLPALHHPLLASFRVDSPTLKRLLSDRSLRPAVTLWFGMTVQAGHISAIRVAVGMAHPSPVCITLPTDLPLSGLGPDADRIAADVDQRLPPPMTDGHASATYRRRMITVLLRRLLIRAAGDT